MIHNVVHLFFDLRRVQENDDAWTFAVRNDDTRNVIKQFPHIGPRGWIQEQIHVTAQEMLLKLVQQGGLLLTKDQYSMGVLMPQEHVEQIERAVAARQAAHEYPPQLPLAQSQPPQEQPPVVQPPPARPPAAWPGAQKQPPPISPRHPGARRYTRDPGEWDFNPENN